MLLLTLLFLPLLTHSLPLTPRDCTWPSICPDNPAPYEPPLTHGWCGIHVQQVFGNPSSHERKRGDNRTGNVTASVYDAAGHLMGHLYPTPFNYSWSLPQGTVGVGGRLGEEVWLSTTGEGGIDKVTGPMYDKQRGVGMRIEFRYKGDLWLSDNTERCTVGKINEYRVFDIGVYNFYDAVGWTRDMDCGFAC